MADKPNVFGWLWLIAAANSSVNIYPPLQAWRPFWKWKPTFLLFLILLFLLRCGAGWWLQPTTTSMWPTSSGCLGKDATCTPPWCSPTPPTNSESGCSSASDGVGLPVCVNEMYLFTFLTSWLFTCLSLHLSDFTPIYLPVCPLSSPVHLSFCFQAFRFPSLWRGLLGSCTTTTRSELLFCFDLLSSPQVDLTHLYLSEVTWQQLDCFWSQ